MEAMENTTSGTTEPVENQVEADPWAAAFAALEPKDKEDAEGNTSDDGDQATGDPEQSGGQQELSDQDDADNGSASKDDSGGYGDNAGDPDQEDGSPFAEMLGLTEESIEQYEQELDKSLRDQAIDDIAKEFIKRGVRNTKGVLGATIDDPDICKRDEDGVPHFYNPETGREFTGDNPRREAKQWVDDYNEELAKVFNTTCAQYEKRLKEDSAPQLALRKFAPKYSKLDEIRKGMFNNVVQDYEVKDDAGKVVGYSCDLDKALALVERQISMIQNYAKKQGVQKQQPTGPAVDMKTSSGAMQSGERPAPTSLAEAMERLQDAELEKIKR